MESYAQRVTKIPEVVPDVFFDRSFAGPHRGAPGVSVGRFTDLSGCGVAIHRGLRQNDAILLVHRGKNQRVAER